MARLGKYSIGLGDRFAQQTVPQLRACILAKDAGAEVTPVWNKSPREHRLLGSDPAATRKAADAAVAELCWDGAYFVDADHIRLDTVDAFVGYCDYFTIDIAETIGLRPQPSDLDLFMARCRDLVGTYKIPGLETPITVTRADVQRIGNQYLTPVQQAAHLYRHLASNLGEGGFVAEIAMDEAEEPQGPVELLLILAALGHEEVPVEVVAPRFHGRFNKGVEFTGDASAFAAEFAADLAVIAYASQRYDMAPGLKLSLHSGSDKFSLFPAMRSALHRFDAGVHIKTAGTSWLEELIGLAMSGGDGLELVRELACNALERRNALTESYASMVEIDSAKLPTADQIRLWDGDQFRKALRHDTNEPEYNPDLRQLLHISYRIAGRMGDRYLKAVRANRDTIGANITANLYERHLRPLFVPVPPTAD